MIATNQYISLSYWKVTKNICYSLLFIFPMVLLYEIMCWIQYAEGPSEIRNGADVFIRHLILGHGKYSESIYGFFLIILFLVIMYYNRNVIISGRLKFSFLFYMIIESMIWCLGFIILMSISERLILFINERNIIPEQFYLAIGAGIWEELLFRVCAIGLFLNLLTKFIGYNVISSSFIAILFSAVLFSLFHYLGPFADIFTYKSFCIRGLAGIFLGSLYLFRGLGITVYTHIFYDIVIISMPIMATKS